MQKQPISFKPIKINKIDIIERDDDIDLIDIEVDEDHTFFVSTLAENWVLTHNSGYPDIDSDISDRDRLLELLRNKFGSKNIIPISNYNTFKLKSLIKDISRFYGIPFEEVNAAMAPIEDDVKKELFKPGTDKNLFVLTYEDAIKYSKSLQDFIAAHPEVAGPIKILFKQNRSLGRHAGGVIVSENIAERMPLILSRGEPQTPWVEGMTYKHLEELGWIKFDLLGLETLRIIERSIHLILQRREGVANPSFSQIREWFDKHMDPKNIDLNDQKVYEYVYHEGRFAGVFQLANVGAQRLFMKAKPRSIIDIATLTSIYRPGPLAANVDKLYLEAKANPDKIDYQHPLIKKVLEQTYGCLHGSTMITTEDGDISIENIVNDQLIGIKLPSYNETTGEIEQDEVVAAVCNGVKDTLTIETEDGKTIVLTSDHRVYTTRGWVEAGNLTLEDEILGIMLTPLKIKSIKRSNQARVYDIQTRKNHNFVANGLLVHNCIVFQESIMKLCSVVAGFPEAETDTIRRNLLKRTAAKRDANFDEAKKTKDDFVAGSVRNGVPEKVADDLFEKILYFAGYGFNASHAVSYAIDSYYCAWLLTYYEEEWLCAYLESMSGSDDKRAKAFAEVKALGYKISPLDINYATDNWTILDGKRFMPSFLSCKGVGASAIEEIVQKRPYRSIEDLLWNEDGSWKHSKFNKRALEALIALKAFDSLECVGKERVFSNYRQMHEILINRSNDIKKSTKKNPWAGADAFKIALKETAELEDWTRREVVENSIKYTSSFNPASLVSDYLMQKLEEKSIKPIDEAEHTDVYWFVIMNVKQKTTKNGKPYLLLETSGPSGQVKRIFCWGWDGRTEVPAYSVCLSEVTLDAYGMKTFQSKLKMLEV